MIESLKRRWFKFSLRSLFVVVTMIGCWLGYELRWVHQRHEAIVTGCVYSEDIDPSSGAPRIVPAPGLLWLFGERGHGFVYIKAPRSWDGTAAEDAELDRLERLFPEAIIGTESDPEPEPPPKPAATTPGSPYDGFML